MPALRSAVFIDFDNFFGGLVAADPKTALEVVESPSAWLNRLVTADADNERRWLILRCYMNPAGWVANPVKPDERLYFSRFRPYFTQAGVEVVDCPSLTKGAKNGADIRIAVDVMAALSAPTRYDEFVLMSSDADFTPLLQAVRAQDRRITMVATGSTAAAFEALADHLMTEQDVVQLLETPPTLGASWDEFVELVRRRYAEADGPLNLSRLATEVRAALVELPGDWFGHETFGAALRAVDLPGAVFSQYELVDGRAAVKIPIPAEVSRLAQLTKLPRVSEETWQVVYECLGEYAATHEFRLAESATWARDRAQQRGVLVGRSTFDYAVRAALIGGKPLNAQPPPTAGEIASAVHRSVVERAKAAGWEHSEADELVLARWLGAVTD